MGELLMFQNRNGVFLIVVLVLCSCAFSDDKRFVRTELGDPIAERRQEALKSLMTEYEVVTSNIVVAFETARKHHKDDASYSSPLHIAISAINSWKILPAENSLLELVDYQLDANTFPVGVCMSEAYVFPAADALVNLRVDCDKVIRSISATSSKRRQFVLAWLLIQRVGDCVTAQTMLSSAGKKFHGVSERKNIQATIKILESSSDWLGDAMEMANQDKK